MGAEGSDSEEDDFAAASSDDDEDDGAYEGEQEEEEEEEEPQVLSQAELKKRNVQAMLSGSLVTSRRPIMRGLKCQDVAAVLARPFRAPFAGASEGHSAELARRLAARRRFVPWGSQTNIAPAIGRPLGLAKPFGLPKPEEPKEEDLPPGVEPLILWEDPEGKAAPISVDNMLVKFLRPHQREGVKFMYECVMGLRGFAGNGCILADDMGLGKTLQGITLLWTLLCQGMDGTPTAKRALIVCPTSLVSNWDDECNKWLKGKVKTMPICESSRADVISSVTRFLGPRNTAQVMIVSYETFRIHAERFKDPESVHLVMCDEAHRLKNGDTLTNKALCSVPCARRVMLSGTPMQNNLDEFFSMVEFCNPGLLGTPSEFHKHYERPILAGREPDATEKQLALAQERNGELGELVDKFVLRRTNTILSKHLPPKVVEVVCCKLSPLQSTLYHHFLESKAAKAALTGKNAMVLAAITALKKLCNHPKLIYDMVNGAKNTGGSAAGFEDVGGFFEPGMYDARGPGNRGGGGMCPGWEFHSGKFAVVARLLAILRAETKDRVVIISNYTQTLDLMQVLCRQNNYPVVRLDGSTSITKRQKLVRQFNDPAENCFVFLLSSKAGGCGINLVGGNRLILFDPDWNPANDKQAAARCWRDGQKKKCYLYRLLATGTIEEKVFQRQLSKESLQNVVNGEGTLEQASLTSEELRRLFTLDETTVSDTHDGVGCEKCPGAHYAGHVHAEHPPPDGPDGKPPATWELMQPWEEQDEEPEEQRLETWGHHHRMSTVPDPIMRRAAGDDVSFLFSLQVDGCAVAQEEPKPPPGALPAPDAALPAAAGAVKTRTALASSGYRLGVSRPGTLGGGTGGGNAGGGYRPAAGRASGQLTAEQRPGSLRRPLSAVTANVAATRPVAATVAAKPSAGGKPRAGAPTTAAAKRQAPTAARNARRRKHDSESEEEFEESDTEEEEEDESEEEGGESDSAAGDVEDSDSDISEPKVKPASARPVRAAAPGAAGPASAERKPPARPRRGAAVAAGDKAKKKRRTGGWAPDTDSEGVCESEDEESEATEDSEPSEDEGSDEGATSGEEAGGDAEDDVVADSEEEDDAPRRHGSAAPENTPDATYKRPRHHQTVNRASVNVPDRSARAGVEVDAKRGRWSEGGASVDTPDSPSADELMMIPSDSESDESSEM